MKYCVSSPHGAPVVPGDVTVLRYKYFVSPYAERPATPAYFVTERLGCADANVFADLYELLVYNESDFFEAHATPRRPGTLLIVLPSPASNTPWVEKLSQCVSMALTRTTRDSADTPPDRSTPKFSRHANY